MKKVVETKESSSAVGRATVCLERVRAITLGPRESTEESKLAG